MEKPTIDQQIEFINDHLRNKSLETDQSNELYLAIKENLIAVKRWNETPAYHSEIDVEKVIEDLIADAKHGIACGTLKRDENTDPVIQNAEAALGMLQAFKQKREEPQYEYEMYFNSESDEPVQIHGWYPIATDRIKDKSKIPHYIETGLLRKI